MRYYTYLYLREDGTPYYVGKGSGYRAFVRRGRVISPPLDKSYILIQEFLSEPDSFCAEKLLIEIYGRRDLGTGILHNRTDGGEGTSGLTRVVSEQQRKDHSNFMRGKPKPLCQRENMVLGAKIRWLTISDANENLRYSLRNLAKSSQPKTNHIRWHVRRDLVKEGCSFCTEGNDASL